MNGSCFFDRINKIYKMEDGVEFLCLSFLLNLVNFVNPVEDIRRTFRDGILRTEALPIFA